MYFVFVVISALVLFAFRRLLKDKTLISSLGIHIIVLALGWAGFNFFLAMCLLADFLEKTQNTLAVTDSDISFWFLAIFINCLVGCLIGIRGILLNRNVR